MNSTVVADAEGEEVQHCTVDPAPSRPADDVMNIGGVVAGTRTL